MLGVGCACDLSIFVKLMLNIFINDGLLEEGGITPACADQEILVGEWVVVKSIKLYDLFSVIYLCKRWPH